MAVSGSNNFTVNRLTIINRALRMVGAIDKGQNADKKLELEAGIALNMILKEIDLDFMGLHQIAQVDFNCSAGQAVYAVSDGLPNNINEIKTAVYQFSGTDERTLHVISYTEYESFVDKTTQGDPERILLSKDLDTADRTITLYPTPQDNKPVRLTYWRRIFDMASNDDLDLPPESFSFITYRLASDMAEEYNVPDNKASRLFQKQNELWTKLKSKLVPKVTNAPVKERQFF